MVGQQVMNDLILLGAGASTEAGLKDAKGMTQQLLEISAQRSSLASSVQQTRLLYFVVGGLLFQQSVSGNDPLTSGVNIEAVFNAIELLGRRRDVEFAPLVSAWHPVLEELARPSEDPWHEQREFEQRFEQAMAGLFSQYGSGFSVRGLYDTVIQMIDTRASSNNQIFHSTLEWMIRALIDMVQIKDENSTSYLIPLLKVNGTKKRTIATLNYDSTIEIAARLADIPVFVGIEQWKPGVYPCKDEGIQLLKLHGSADWEIHEEYPTSTNPFPQPKISVHSSDKRPNSHPNPDGSIPSPGKYHNPEYKPAVIFGGMNKLTTQGPFLDLLRVFRNELDVADRLTIIGYSFRDSHINDYIYQWLSNDSKSLRIINGPSFSESRDGFAGRLLELQKMSPGLKQGIKDLGCCAIEGIQKCFGDN